MKVTREPATLLPVLEIAGRTIPVSDDIKLRDLYDGLMDRPVTEVVDYGRAKQIRDARLEKRLKMQRKRDGGIQVIRHLD